MIFSLRNDNGTIILALFVSKHVCQKEETMTLHDLIYSRQSIRKFKDTPVPDEDVLTILDSIRVGPSSENEQNWHFLVVRNQEFKDKLEQVILAAQRKVSEELEAVDEKAARRFEKFIRLFTLFALKAPVLVLVYSFTVPACATREYTLLGKPQEMIDELQLQSTGMQGLGASLEHGVLTMMEMGYGTTLMTSQNFCHRDIEKLIEEELGFSREGWFLAAMFPIGVPDGEAKSPGRTPLDELVNFYN